MTVPMTASDSEPPLGSSARSAVARLGGAARGSSCQPLARRAPCRSAWGSTAPSRAGGALRCRSRTCRRPASSCRRPAAPCRRTDAFGGTAARRSWRTTRAPGRSAARARPARPRCPRRTARPGTWRRAWRRWPARSGPGTSPGRAAAPRSWRSVPSSSGASAFSVMRSSSAGTRAARARRRHDLGVAHPTQQLLGGHADPWPRPATASTGTAAARSAAPTG